MMLSPNSTHDVRLGFSLPEWDIDKYSNEDIAAWNML